MASLMTSCNTISVGACRCGILLNPTINFVGAYGAKHWVLIDWSRSWINLEIAGKKLELEMGEGLYF